MQTPGLAPKSAPSHSVSIPILENIIPNLASATREIYSLLNSHISLSSGAIPASLHDGLDLLSVHLVVLGHLLDLSLN